jgi:dienelactone hydrolase
MFTAEDSRSPWNRSPLNGFRCVKYPDTEKPVAKVLLNPLERTPARDLSQLKPFTDEEFKSLLAQYDYDITPLNAKVEDINDSYPFWRREKITFDAAYDAERMTAYLFLPKEAEAPYQTAIYFPGMGAISDESFIGLPYSYMNEFVIKSGRALLFPVYKGTYERPVARGRIWTMTSVVETPLAYRDWTFKIAKDLGRSIDYLQTRNDIDSEKIAYYGMSWGAIMGPVMMAVEDRLKTGIFVAGGLAPIDLPRSFDSALYAQKVKIPVLMVNGREDVLLPYITSQKPMYELLGTNDEHKKHKLYPGGHGVFGLFYRQIQDDVIDWLDHYLGEVQ